MHLGYAQVHSYGDLVAVSLRNTYDHAVIVYLTRAQARDIAAALVEHAAPPAPTFRLTPASEAVA